MSDWLIGLEGTAAGAHLAMGLALLAAFAHACFGALQKGRFDPWTARGAIDVFFSLLALPLILILPWPEPFMWPLFLGVWAIHLLYKIAVALAYERAPYTVVYPVMRGTGPLLTVAASGMVFGEYFTALQWAGVGTLVCGIFGLGLYNIWALALGRARMVTALAWALLTGAFVALYTVWDAYAIRATASPFTFLAWFFFIDGLSMPVIALIRARARNITLDVPALARLGLGGGLLGFVSFGAVMLATRLDEVGEAAVLRETSVVFAALIGWLWLKEPVGPRRGALIILIALGAIIVEFGG